MSLNDRRLLLVHAHPDDETIATGVAATLLVVMELTKLALRMERREALRRAPQL